MELVYIIVLIGRRRKGNVFQSIFDFFTSAAYVINHETNWKHVRKLYSGISLRRTHHKADTLYKADREFSPILYFSGQTLVKVISIKRTLL